MSESSTLKPHQALKQAYAELQEKDEFDLDEVVDLATDILGGAAEAFYQAAFGEWMKKKARALFSNEKGREEKGDDQIDMFGFSENRRMPILREDGSFGYRRMGSMLYSHMLQIDERKASIALSGQDEYRDFRKLMKKVGPVMSKDLNLTYADAIKVLARRRKVKTLPKKQ